MKFKTEKNLKIINEIVSFCYHFASNDVTVNIKNNDSTSVITINAIIVKMFVNFFIFIILPFVFYEANYTFYFFKLQHFSKTFHIFYSKLNYQKQIVLAFFLNIALLLLLLLLQFHLLYLNHLYLQLIYVEMI